MEGKNNKSLYGIFRFLLNPPSRRAAAFLIAIACVSYFPAFRGGYVWDDAAVRDNPALGLPNGLQTIWLKPGAILNETHFWPLTYTSFWIETRFFGAHPQVYHAVNVLLHAFNSILLFLTLRRLGIPGALPSAVFFCVHPVHVESVAWIIERKDVLSGAFALASVFFFVAPDEHRRGSNWLAPLLSAASYGCALLSKSSVVGMPFVMAMICWASHRKIDRARIAVLGVMLVMAAIYCSFDLALGRRLGKNINFNLPWAARIAVAGAALWFYIGKLIIPWPLLTMYPHWYPLDWSLTSMTFPIGWVLLTAFTWGNRGRIGRWPFAIIVLFGILHLPTLGFVNYNFMRISCVADRFQYLACSAPLAGLGFWVARAIERRPRRLAASVTGAAFLMATVWGVLSWRQSALYESSERLFEHVLRYNPQNPLALNIYGMALNRRGAYREAEEYLSRAVEILPTYAMIWNNLAVCHEAKSDCDKAIIFCKRSIALNPGDVNGYYNLAVAYERKGDPERARQAYENAISIDPYWERLRVGFADFLMKHGRLDEAIPHYRAVLERWPNRDDVRRDLAAALARAADPERNSKSNTRTAKVAENREEPQRHEILSK